MNKFQYYKRSLNGKVVQLHLHENKEDCIIAKVYPEPVSEEVYQSNEFELLDSVDEWLDEGLKSKIFDTKPIPNYSG